MAPILLDSLFQNGAVLQRNKPIYFWGTAPSNQVVHISFAGSNQEVVSENDKWFCSFAPLKASFSEVVEITCGEKVIRSEVMIGDVFIAAGQSNMEFFLNYESHFDEAINSPINHNIRYYNVPRIAFSGQIKKQEDCGHWFDNEDKESLKCFSAPAFWFSRMLADAINVPIGIIGCNFGGTTASSWLAESYLSESPLSVYLSDYEKAVQGKDLRMLEEQGRKAWAFFETPEHKKEVSCRMYGLSRPEQVFHMKSYSDKPSIPMGPVNKNRPGCLFHFMLSQIIPFQISAVLWYQGENDEHHAELYSTLFSALVNCWRKSFENSELPFFTVQLSSFRRGMTLNGNNFPKIREQQELAAQSIRHVYMTCSMDKGMLYDIHPKEKKEIGRRLFLQVYQHLYSGAVNGDCPYAESISVSDNKISIIVNNSNNGLLKKPNCKKAFEIIEKEKSIKIRKLTVRGNRIIIFLDARVLDETEIRFAYRDYCIIPVFNSDGLPLLPFCKKLHI